jgi:hypothetical protein
MYSCKEKEHSASEKKYSPVLQVQADSAARYYYTISNETSTGMEVNGKKTETSNRSVAGLLYTLSKDSTGGYLLQVTYDSLHIVTKTGDKQTTMDAADAAFSLNPQERLLGGLKGASVTVQLDKKGKVLAVNGYKEIADKLMANIDITTEAERQRVQKQLYDMLGEGFVKNNLEQGFGIFPDTAVYEGDSWEKKTTQSSLLKVDINTRYTLDEVENDIGTVNSVAQISGSSNNTADALNNQPTGNLQGKGKGSYTINMQTGMLMRERSSLSIEGTIQVNGTEVPVTIESKKEISSRKL